MPTEIYKDILDVREGIICQQINPFVMGAGLALAIRRLYPKVHGEFLDRKKTDPIGLGDVLFVDVSNELTIASMCAQHNYGRDPNSVYTSYPRFQECLTLVHIHATRGSKRREVYFPYKIGCGLAGGSWRIIYNYIDILTPYAHICKLGRKPK